MFLSNLNVKFIMYNLVSSFILNKKNCITLKKLTFIVYIKLISLSKDILILLFLYLCFIFCHYPLFKESSILKKGASRKFNFFFFSFDLVSFFSFYQKFLNLYLRLNEEQNFSSIYNLSGVSNKNNFFYIAFFLGTLPLSFVIDKILEKNISYIYILQSIKVLCKVFYLYYNRSFILFLTKLLKLPLNIIKNG